MDFELEQSVLPSRLNVNSPSHQVMLFGKTIYFPFLNQGPVSVTYLSPKLKYLSYLYLTFCWARFYHDLIWVNRLKSIDLSKTFKHGS